MHDVEFLVLGPLEVRVGDCSVAIGSRKQRVLLAALAVEGGRPVSTDALSELLWDGAAPPSVRVTLRSLVSRLRHSLGDAGPCLASRGGGYLLQVDLECLDTVRFERGLARGRDHLAAGRADDAAAALHEALSLWRGPAHAELDGHEFARAAAHHLEEARAAAVEDLVDAELAAGRIADALHRAEAQVVAHPLRERAWGQLMLARYRCGRQADALAAYREVHALLRDELGVAPTPDLVALEAAILRQDPRLTSEGSAGRPARHRGPDLPTVPTPLVGRSVELAELAAVLPSTRLLTLTGTGGVGKTRLALHLASDAAPAHDGDVRLVELAPLAAASDVAAVLGEVASALGVATIGSGGPAHALRRIVDQIGDRPLLLVVDNCEHVIDAVARSVDDLRRQCPRLTVLATSREPLGVAGEVTRLVTPLSLPPSNAADLRDLAESDAVALFRERARAAHAGFELHAGNAAAVALICRRLDGIPLALELAAARVRVLATEQIAARLDDPFALLTTGARTAAPRQRTLRAAVEWSHDLLDEPERVVLRRLAVFAATFDLDAAEAVAGGSPGSVADVVFRLVDKSVVATRHRRGDVRFVLLETVRGFAAERLAEAGETADVRARHRAHYVGLAREHRRVWGTGWDSALWHRRVSAEEENFRAAVVSALADGDHDGAALLLSGLWVHWAWAAGRSEAIGWLERVVHGPGKDRIARSGCAVGLAALLRWWEVGDPERSMALFALAEELAETADDDGSRFWARYFRAEFRMLRGDPEGARADYRQALGVAGPRGSAGWCRYSFGWIAMGTGDAALARVEFAHAVELSGPDDLVRPHALAALAPLLAATDPARAAIVAAQAVESARQFPLPGVHVMALVRAAQAHVLRGADGDAAAREAVDELFDLQHRLGNLQFRAESFEVLAVLAARSGDHGAAARYLGAAGAVRMARTEDRAGVRLLGTAVAAARGRVLAALGTDAYGRESAAGAAVPALRLVAEVRAARPCP